MQPEMTLNLAYILFIWMVVLHTLEEISHGIMELELGRLKLTPKKYLRAASAITTLNLFTLALIILNEPAGYYIALFTSGVIGILQAVVHGIGYLKEGRQPRGLGVGFYTSIPLAITGGIVFYQCLRLV